MILFSINPAFDLLPQPRDINQYFADEYDEALGGIAPEREELYRICEHLEVGITVMEGVCRRTFIRCPHLPFGVALTPVQCLHYALLHGPLSPV